MRLDLYLTKNGYSPSRNRAAELISGGFVLVNGKPVSKNSYDVADNDEISVTGKEHEFVGRGGMKLEAAIGRFEIQVNGEICADIGASTGGFTDCLLMRGARHVYAVDSGHGQLAEKLLNDGRVTNLEGCNARYINSDIIPEKCGIVVCDLSFISQTLVHHAITDITSDGAAVITLVKPQFECGREALGKGGIVKHKKDHELALRRVIMSANDNGLSPQSVMKSPIKGGDGNTEFLLYMKKGDVSRVSSDDIRRTVNEET